MRALPARATSAGEDPALAMVLPVLERVRLAVEAENGELSRGHAVDYPAHSQRKSQGLLELSRMRAPLAVVSAHPAVAAMLADLSVELDLNRRLLQIRLRAARTVAGILARAIREGQSDGTYSAHVWRENER